MPKDEAGDPKRNGAARDLGQRREGDPKPTLAASAGRQVAHAEADDRGKAGKARRKPAAARPAAPRPRPSSSSACSPTRRGRTRARTAASSRSSTTTRTRERAAASSRPTATTSRAASRCRRDDAQAAARCKKGSRVIAGTILGRVGADARPARRRTSTSRSGPPAAAPRRSTRSRSSTAGSCSSRPRSTARPARTPSTARTATASRSARSCCCRSRCSRSASSPTSASRSTRAAAATSRPARSTAACWPRSSTWPSPACGPTVTSLKCGHGFYTSSRQRLAPLVRQRGRHRARSTASRSSATRTRAGSPSRRVERLMLLQGTMRPDQIISLLDMGQNTVAMGDHDDHIHVGFRPLFGDEHEARQAGVRGPQARPVGRPDRPPARDRQPDGAGQAVEVRAAGQAEAPRQRRAPRRVARPAGRCSASSSSSSASRSGRPTAAT